MFIHSKERTVRRSKLKCPMRGGDVKRLLDATSLQILMNLMFKMSLFILINLMNIALIKCIYRFVNFDQMFQWIFHFQCWFEYVSNFD
jgi:hypothetical protein